MSQENVEIAQRGWDAFLEEGIEGIFRFYSEDAEIVDAPELPDPTVGHGAQGLRRLWGNLSEMWEAFSLTPTEFIDAGEDQVIAVCAMKGSGKESGIPIPDTPLVLLYDLEDGLIVRQRAFLSRERALEAAGSD